jgi:cysteine sulfinate desulfinase/cysteine desulfurase-like protein
MFMRATLAGVVVTVLMSAGVAAQSVDSTTVEALRQIAIAAGQTSSSAVSPPAKSLEALETEQKSLHRHRADFFARTYARKPDSTVVQERAAGSGVSLSLLGLHGAPQPVDRESIQALRQIAIAAGQASSSAAQPPTKSLDAIKAEQRSLEAHRADFFERAYTGQPLM